jgi:hypothetical protein
MWQGAGGGMRFALVGYPNPGQGTPSPCGRARSPPGQRQATWDTQGAGMTGLEAVLIGVMLLEMLFLLALLTLAALPVLTRVVKNHVHPPEESGSAAAARD